MKKTQHHLESSKKQQWTSYTWTWMIITQTKTFQQSNMAMNKWTVERCGLKSGDFPLPYLCSSIRVFFSHHHLLWPKNKQHSNGHLGLFQSLWLTRFLHPRKLTWHPKIDTWKRSSLLETIILRFHVSFRECISFLDSSRESWYIQDALI